jgi:alkylated DNA repair dioxygenase AlkB
MGELSGLDWDGRGVIRRMGQVVKRRELDFIRNYGRHTRRVAAGLPLPEFLWSLRDRCAAATGIQPEEFQQVITSLYRPDAGIDWHVDSTKAFGESICGVSLASRCIIQFRPVGGGDIWPLELEPRSLFILQGPARWNYQHRIPAVKALRYSITLRAVR